ncbi:MAG: oligosaccharide flippase family protein [bacterium]
MDIRKDSFITYFTRLITFVVQIVTGLLLARILGPEGRGEYALLVIVPTMAGIFCNMGIGTSNVYFVGSRKIKLDKIISNSLTIALIIGGITILILNFLATEITIKIFKGIRTDYFRLAIISIPFLLLYIFLMSVIHGRRDFVRYNILNVLRPVTFILIFVLCYLIFKFKVLAGIIAWDFAAIIAAIGSIFFVKNLTSLRLKLKIDFEALKQILKYGSKVYLGEVVTFLNYRLNIMFIGFFLNPTQVGYFAIVIVIAESLWFMSASVGVVMFPTVASMDKNKAAEIMPKVVRNIFFVTTLMVLALSSIDRYIISLTFGEAFLPALKPLRLLYPGIAVFSVMKIISSYILGQGKPNVTMNISIVGLIINIALNIMLIPVWGINGAAFASTLSYFLLTLIEVIWFIKTTNINWTDLLIIEWSDLKVYPRLVSDVKKYLYNLILLK